MPTYSQNTRCTVQLGRGGFCDAQSAPDMPFPICARHAIALYRRLHETVTEVKDNYRDHMDVHVAMVGQVAAAGEARVNTAYHQTPPRRAQGVVPTRA